MFLKMKFIFKVTQVIGKLALCNKVLAKARFCVSSDYRSFTCYSLRHPIYIEFVLGFRFKND